MSGIRRAAAAAAIVASSFVLSVAGAEVFLDVFHGVLPRDVRIMWIRRAALPRTIVYDPRLGYSLRPDYSAEFRNGAKKLRIRHVAYPSCPERGFRGSPGDEKPGADAAIVGDSILYGAEVDQGATMPAQLARLSGRRVVNLAVTGYGTTQELEQYRTCGSRLRPKLVLLFPFANDPLDNIHFERWANTAAAQPLPFAKWCMIMGVRWPSPLCTALTAVDARFTLGDLVVHRWARAIKFGSLDDPLVAAGGVDSMCRDIGGFRDLTRGEGTRLAAVFPGQWRMMGAAQRAALDRVIACTRSLGVPVLDLGAGGSFAPGLLGRLDGHWNEAGHLRAAEETWRFLLGEGLLAPGPARTTGPRGDPPSGRFVAACDRLDARLGFAYSPGCAAWRVWDGAATWVSYNALGLRDKDYSRLPAPGRTRVLAIGGSVVGGSGLDDRDVPPRSLERSLRRRGLDAEVINGAAEGYIGWQTAVALPALLRAYSPRAVVYYLPPHYVFADRVARPLLESAEGRILGLAERERFPVLDDVLGRVRASRELARLADRGARFDDLVAPTLSELGQMRDDCRARGVRFFVAYAGGPLLAARPVPRRRVPAANRVIESLFLRPFRVEGSVLAERLRREGFELLSLSRDAAALSSPEDRLADGHHWNARGSAAFGEAVARELVSALKSGPGRPTARARSPGPSGPLRD